MPKFNYLRHLIDSFSEQNLKSVVEEFAEQNKLFEAFLIKHSGIKIDTGKSYLDYREELEKILKRCTTRKGFVKVTRLQKAGVESFRELLHSHMNNENFETSLWMSLVLLEVMHRAILMNTRYQSYPKPFKVFEKKFEESRDIFDSCSKIIEPERKKRPEIFKALLRCWFRERERFYEKKYFNVEDLFQYIKRDEDLMALQLCIQELKPRALEIDNKSKRSFWRTLKPSSEGSLSTTLSNLEKKVIDKLDSWE